MTPPPATPLGSRLSPMAWPPERVADALVALARAHGMPLRQSEVAAPPGPLDPERLSRWIDRTCAWVGLEAEPLDAAVADLDSTLAGAVPAIVALPGGGVLGVLGSRRGRLRVLGPDLARSWVRIADVRDALLPTHGTKAVHDMDALLDAAGVVGARRGRVRRGLVRAALASHRIGGMWLLRVPPSTSFVTHLRRARIPGRASLLLGVHALATALSAVGFWFVGRAALEGRIESGWLAAWAIVVAAQAPLAIYVEWAQAQVAIDVGMLLKRRLLAGALSLPSDRIRTAGAGELLGRVLESEAVESLALQGGFAGLTAAIELAGAGIVLWLGASGGLACALLAAWVGATAIGAVRYVRRRRGWTDARIAMTHELIERMVGHRTRLAQQPAARWHEGEDETLADYLARSAALDGSAARVTALFPQAWMVLGVLAVAVSFVSGGASEASLAVSLGGVLMAARALRRLAQGVTSVSGAVVAWEKVAPIFHAPEGDEPPPAPEVAFGSDAAPRDRDLVEAREIVFRHRPAAEAVLAGASMRIRSGDRVLLEGASGCGKSTLASILCGLRRPQSGLVLCGGLDRGTLGLDGWRRTIAAAPQFHENHVLSATLAFNLLLGRRWPPAGTDFEEAASVCAELGLGELLARMPSGMQQQVGETGWQLSHGECSRVFIARALLQNPGVVVLDESLAALDPDTLEQVLGAVLRRTNALVLIAHP